jgi:hypothetical protein
MRRKLCPIGVFGAFLAVFVCATLQSGPQRLTGLALANVVGAKHDCDTHSPFQGTACDPVVVGNQCRSNYLKCPDATAGLNDVLCDPGAGGAANCNGNASCKKTNNDAFSDKDCNAN